MFRYFIGVWFLYCFDLDITKIPSLLVCPVKRVHITLRGFYHIFVMLWNPKASMVLVQIERFAFVHQLSTSCTQQLHKQILQTIDRSL